MIFDRGSVQIAMRICKSTGLAALACFAFANVLFWVTPAREALAGLRDPDRFLWYTKITAARESEVWIAGTDTLILGDSQAMSGIVPQILDAHLGTRSVNLGMPSQQPEGLLALARLLPPATQGRRRVFVNVNPFSLFESPVRRSFEYYFQNELARYAAPAASDFLVGPGDWLHQRLLALPLYEANFIFAPLVGLGAAGLSEFPFAELQARPDSLPAEEYVAYLAGERPGLLALLRERVAGNRRLARILDESRGFWTWRDLERPDFSGAHCERLARDGGDPSLEYGGRPGEFLYTARPAAIGAYRQALDVLTAKGYEVLLVEIPFSPAYGNMVNEERVYALVDQALAGIVAGLAAPEAVRTLNIESALAVDARAVARRLRSPHAFHDLTHLSACGAAEYTRWLAAETAIRGF